MQERTYTSREHSRTSQSGVNAFTGEEEKSTLSFVNKKFLLLVLVTWVVFFTVTHFTEWQERRRLFNQRREEIRLQNAEDIQIERQNARLTAKKGALER